MIIIFFFQKHWIAYQVKDVVQIDNRHTSKRTISTQKNFKK